VRLKNKMKFDIYSMLSSIAQESALNKDQARGLMIFRLLTEAAQGHQGASFTIRGGEVLLEGTVFNQDESIMLPLGEFISHVGTINISEPTGAELGKIWTAYNKEQS
jgi:hypothetical protein